MHHVDKLLKQNEVTGHGSDTSANQDTVKMPFLEFKGNHLLRGLTKICQTILYLISKCLHPFCCGMQSRQYLFSRHSRECGKVG